MKFQVVITGSPQLAGVVTRMLQSAQAWLAGTGLHLSYEREPDE